MPTRAPTASPTSQYGWLYQNTYAQRIHHGPVVAVSGESLVSDGEVFGAVGEEGDGPAREVPALRHCHESYFRNIFGYVEFAIWPTVVAGVGARVLQQHGPSKPSGNEGADTFPATRAWPPA